MTEAEKKAEYSSDNVQIQVEKEPGCKVKLSIDVTPEATKAALVKAMKTINKEVSIPGFRKGKAPEKLMFERFGSHIDKEWRELLVNTAFQEALKLIEIYPYREEGIKPTIKEIDKEKGSSVLIEFESYPDVPTVDINKISLETPPRDPVTEDEVNETIENIQLHHADWEEVKERPVEENDYVNIDIEIIDKEPMKVADHSRFHVKEGKMGKWMRQLIIGANVGDSVEGMSEQDPSSTLPKEEFKPSNTKITIRSIQTATLPEIDEALAKKVGASSVEDLKEKVERDLNRQADDEVQQQLRDQLREQLMDNFPFDVPASLIDHEKKPHLQAAQQRMQQEGISDEEKAKRMAEVEESLIKDIQEAYQLYFIAAKELHDANIEISQEELMQEVIREMYLNPELRAQMEQDPKQVRERAYGKLMIRRAQDLLIESCQVESE